MKFYFITCFLGLVACSNKQDLTSAKLLEKSIAFHDPNNSWSAFNSNFSIEMTTPDGEQRTSEVLINLPEDYFKLQIRKDETLIEYEIISDSCSMALNGRKTITKKEQDTLKINCERGKLYKNYYTYLYGLPMKLKDPGTFIDGSVNNQNFNNKEYLVLRVTYDPSVGSDIWYFYFDPSTYAMEAYQFFKVDENGSEIKESGEYILLSGIKKIDEILMPKERKWYYNKDNTFLGTDVLK